MMKIIKMLFAGIGLLILLGIVAIGAFIALFDANAYKQNLSELVQQQTGRELAFSGDIELTLYPALGMKLGAMTFANAAGFGEQPMLSVNNASVSVDVLSLLALKPQIAQLQLDGLQLRLQRNAQGKTNWDDLVPEPAPAGPADTPAEAPTAPAEASEFRLEGAFDGLLVSNAQLSWVDDSAGANYRVAISELTTGAIAPDQPFPLQLRMALESVDQLSAQLELKTQLLFKNQVISLSGLQLESSARGALLPVDQLSLQLGAEVSFALADQRLGISAFNTRINTRGGVLTQSVTTLSGEIGFDLLRQELTIGAFDLQSELQGEAVPNGKLKAALSSSRLELALEKRMLKLEELMLALNENQFRGFLQVLDYQRPDLRFELSSERFDLDKLLGVKPSPDVVETQTPEPGPADIQIALPMELLRTLRLDGKISVATLIAQGLTLNDLLLKLDADKGIVRLDPMSMNLYEGTFVGAIQLNAQSEKPAYSVSKRLQGFKIGKFLTDFMGDSMLYGETDLNLKLTAQGDWLSALKASLNGDLSLAVKDGSVKGINIRHSIDAARAKLKREKPPELIEKKTDFSALSLSARIKNGVVSTDDLDMQAPLLRLGGKGSADLVQETVDYLLNAKLVTSFKGQQGGTADELSGLSIPLAIRGPWLAPDIDVQLDEILKARLNAQKQQLSESLDKQKAELARQLAAEKASLKEAEDKALADKKAQLELQQQQLEAAKKAELDALKKEEEDKARKKLDEKLKKLF